MIDAQKPTAVDRLSDEELRKIAGGASVPGPSPQPNPEPFHPPVPGPLPPFSVLG